MANKGIDLTLLSKTIKDKKASKVFIAKSMGVTARTLNNKLNGITSFRASEINVLSKVLMLDDVEKNAIFFN